MIKKRYQLFKRNTVELHYKGCQENDEEIINRNDIRSFRVSDNKEQEQPADFPSVVTTDIIKNKQ